MSAPIDAIEQEVERLEQDAREIEESYTEFFGQCSVEQNGLEVFWKTPPESASENQRKALHDYELWYNSARVLVSEYMSTRLTDFEALYDDFKSRLQLNISAKRGIKIVLDAQHSDFDTQRGIVNSIPARVRVEELKVRKQVSKDVSQGELDKARDLFDNGEVRAGGVIAGIALERYLLMLCQNSDSDIEYNYNDGISALAQKLYEADEIDSSPYSHLQHLATIRADCAHANEVEPDESDVRRLLEDAEDYIRGRKI
ncbi:hypothetical protein [Haloferax chudinovii]|uniref:DUF4145 domain-containing protein n=1 Tax=Haloferax chudinovii TaxID=1109010 RepID=A0ABD5XBM2_9EURY